MTEDLETKWDGSTFGIFPSFFSLLLYCCMLGLWSPESRKVVVCPLNQLVTAEERRTNFIGGFGASFEFERLRAGRGAVLPPTWPLNAGFEGCRP